MCFYCERSLHIQETYQNYNFILANGASLSACGEEDYDAIKESICGFTPIHCQWINKHGLQASLTSEADAEDGNIQSRTHLQAVNGTSARVWQWEFLEGWERETGPEGWMDQSRSTFNEALIQRAQGLRRGWKVTFQDNDPQDYCPTTVSIYRGQKNPQIKVIQPRIKVRILYLTFWYNTGE